MPTKHTKLIGIVSIVGMLIGGLLLIMFSLNHQAEPQPDLLTLPDKFFATPTRYYVGSMKDSLEGWVSSGAVWVDADAKIWIAPDWVATTDKFPDCDQIHIKREGEYIVLFKESLTARGFCDPLVWTPGAANSWGVEKKTDLMPVKLR